MLTTLILALAGVPEVSVTATLEASALEPGTDYEIVVDMELPEGLSHSNKRIAPILQIDVPPGVTLAGRVLTTHQELARNEFLQAPFERAVTEFPTRVGFKLDEVPAKDATIGLNVVGYLVDGEGEHSFLRKRLELPIKPGAHARESKDLKSTWGTDNPLLQIGQRAANFELPREDGSVVALSDYIGETDVIVTTYRAFW